jgi:hypothetical protein
MLYAWRKLVGGDARLLCTGGIPFEFGANLGFARQGRADFDLAG